MKHFISIKKIIQAAGITGIIGMVVLGMFFASNLASAQYTPGTVQVKGSLWSDMPTTDQECRVGILGVGNTMPPECLTEGDIVSNRTNASSGRGFGWIAMWSNISMGNNLFVPKGVEFNPTTGKFIGAAWSDNGGWLQFNPGGTYPLSTLNNTVSVDASISPACLTSTATSCPVFGWARFEAGKASTAGGWDGWVSLSGGGTPPPGGSFYPAYGVTYNKTTGEFSGHAWGDKNAGWIDFSRVKMTITQPVCTDPNAINFNKPEICKYQCTSKRIVAEIGAVPTVYTYSLGDPYPPDCDLSILIVLNFDTCQDISKGENGPLIVYAKGGALPEVCKNPDVCPNLAGVQAPPGPWKISTKDYYLLSDGMCRLDYCSNLDGYQPITLIDPNTGKRYVRGDAWTCVEKTCSARDPGCQDMCPNIDGFQESIPSGYRLDDRGYCVTDEDFCPNIAGIQTSTTINPSTGKPYQKDAGGNCITISCTPGDPLCPTSPIKPIYIEN